MFNSLKLKIIYGLISGIFTLIRQVGKLRRGSQIMSSGIKETKELMLFGIAMSMAVDEATQDGFQWTDVFKLVPAAAKLPEAIAGIDQVDDELADMDEAERAELIAAIQELDFASDASEAVAEQGLRTGVEIAKLIAEIRKARK